MFNILKKGSFEDGQEFNTKEDMNKFFETHDKDDYMILGEKFIMTHREKIDKRKRDLLREAAEYMSIKGNVSDDLDMRIDNGEALRIDSNDKFDYYVLCFGVFVTKNKISGKVKHLNIYWNDQSKGFYVTINKKRKLAAKVVYESFNGKIGPNYKIGYHDGNKYNIDINNLYAE